MTKTRSSAFSDFVAPIGVLLLICIVASALLAFTNGVTAPIIAEAEEQAAEQARIAVMPEADGFEEIQADGLPETVTGVYRATNGAGYVFMLTADGYGGRDTLNITCGIDAEGRITDTQVLSHSETVGLGSKIAGDDFRGQFAGKDSNLEGVDIIGGATYSSNYFIGAIRDAFTAYDMVKEAG